MSNDERDLIEGRTMRHLREAKRELACLQKKRKDMAATLLDAAERLFQPCVSYDGLGATELPSREDRCAIVKDIADAEGKVKDLSSVAEQIQG